MPIMVEIQLKSISKNTHTYIYVCNIHIPGGLIVNQDNLTQCIQSPNIFYTSLMIA